MKQELIRKICKLHGKDANPAWLKTRTLGQLKETYARALSVESLTEREIRRHCDVSFIR